MLSFKMATDELSRLFGRRILRLALLVIMVIPLLYGALYLWAFWDPYGHLDRIPVALVNLDKPARADDETISAGSDLVAELLEQDTFAWTVVSAKRAAEGVERGTYYASLTVPKDFSERLATASGDRPLEAHLKLSKHESKSMITSQIADRVFGEVKAAASASASKGYYENIFLGLSDASDGLRDAADGSSELATGLADASAGAVSLADGATEARDGGDDLAEGLGELSAGAETLSDGTGDLAEGARSVDGGARALVAGVDDLASGADRLSGGADELAEGTEALAAGTTALVSSASQVAGGAHRVDAGVSEARSKLREAAAGAAQVRDGVVGIRALLTAYVAEHPEAASDATFARILSTADSVAAGSGTLASELDAAGVDAETLASGAHVMALGAAQLAEGSVRIQYAASSAAGGARSVAAGAAGVSAGTAQVSGGSAELQAGTRSLAEGSSRLAKGSRTLAEGATAAKSGASLLASGLRRLEGGTAELSDGLGDAASGSRELAEGLTAGVDDLPDYDAASRAMHSDMMSDPVVLDTHRIDPIETYGTGFAPYFIPLALWVGALVCFLIVNPLPEKAVRSGAPAPIVALSGLWPAALLALGQSTLMYVVLRFGLGLRPVQPLAFFGVVLLTAIVYSAIMQWLSVGFGPAGKLLGIVILMLQLTSAAGTFPVETLPAFFRAINPYLPMTYVVAALREAISGGDLVLLAHDAWLLLLFGLIGLLGTSLTAWRARGWDSERLKPMFEL